MEQFKVGDRVQYASETPDTEKQGTVTAIDPVTLTIEWDNDTLSLMRVVDAARVLDVLPCEACKGAGWLHVDNSDHGERIERCDLCQQFDSDEEANKAASPSS